METLHLVIAGVAYVGLVVSVNHYMNRPEVVTKPRSDLYGPAGTETVTFHPTSSPDAPETVFRVQDGCDHVKVYANHALLTNPPKYPWICSKCGEEGTDMPMVMLRVETYEQVKRRFAAEKK